MNQILSFPCDLFTVLPAVYPCPVLLAHILSCFSLSPDELLLLLAATMVGLFGVVRGLSRVEDAWGSVGAGAGIQGAP